MAVTGALLLSLLLVFFSTGSGKVEYRSKDDIGQSSVKIDKFTRYQRQALENRTLEDDHDYYTSVYYPRASNVAYSLWVDISAMNDSEEFDVLESVLSNEFRYFTIHRLPFSFPFYGHIIDSVAVTTSGFLYTSAFYHPYIHLTQYIAPLQADFNPSLNMSARIFIHSSAERFTVQWDGVHNHDHVESGPFTFQVSLLKNGTIHFVYREIPLLIPSINNDNHPVEVGLADAFYVDELYAGGTVVRSIFEYHNVQLNASQDLAFSAYVLDPLPNCVSATSCTECASLKESTSFDCKWCGALNRCSDGLDRFLQQWVINGCLDSSTYQCHLGVGSVVGISISALIPIVVIILVIAIAVIIFIGYKKPTSKLGQFLIKYRPKARTLNKAGASYNVNSGRTILKEDLGS